MPITGDYTSQDYLLPDDLPKDPYGGMMQQGGQQSGPQFNYKPESGLEEIDGRTSEYYKKYADLNSFANIMWKNYKVDVTRPDTSNPIAIEAYKTYNKQLADVMHEGNALKEANKRADYLMKGAAEGKLILDEQYARDQQGSRITSTDEVLSAAGPGKVSDMVSLVQQKMKGYYDQGEFEAADEYKSQAIDYYTQKQQEAIDAGDFGMAEHHRKNIEAIGAPSLMDDWRKKKADEELALKRSEQARKWHATNKQYEKDSSVYDTVIRDWSNIINGNPDAFEESQLQTPSGGLYYENAEYKGMSYPGGTGKNGQPINKVIKRFLLDTETDKVTLQFEDGSAMNIPRSGDVYPYMASLSKANPQQYNLKDMSKFAIESNLAKKSGGWNYLLDDDDAARTEEFKLSSTGRASYAKDVASTFEQQLKSGKTFAVANSTGEPFKFAVSDSKGKKTVHDANSIEIEKAFTLTGTKYNIMIDGSDIAEDKTLDEIKAILNENGIYGKITDGDLDINDKYGVSIKPAVKQTYKKHSGRNGVGVRSNNAGKITTPDGSYKYESTGSTNGGDKPNEENWDK